MLQRQKKANDTKYNALHFLDGENKMKLFRKTQEYRSQIEKLDLLIKKQEEPSANHTSNRMKKQAERLAEAEKKRNREYERNQKMINTDWDTHIKSLEEAKRQAA